MPIFANILYFIFASALWSFHNHPILWMKATTQDGLIKLWGAVKTHRPFYNGGKVRIECNEWLELPWFYARFTFQVTRAHLQRCFKTTFTLEIAALAIFTPSWWMRMKWLTTISNQLLASACIQTGKRLLLQHKLMLHWGTGVLWMKVGNPNIALSLIFIFPLSSGMPSRD